MISLLTRGVRYIVARHVAKDPMLRRRLSSQLPTTAGVISLVDNICGSAANTPLSQQLAQGKQFREAYHHLNEKSRTEVLAHLSRNWAFDKKDILNAVQEFSTSSLDDPELSAEAFGAKVQRMTAVSRPKFHCLLSSIGHLRGGVHFLLDLRADLLNTLSTSNRNQCPDADNLRSLDAVLKELLGYWFSVGLLQLNRITWKAPSELLEKMADVEAVHPVRNWADIKRRVGPYRRCFTFTHPAIPDEPLVILHVALMNHVSDNINDIVTREDILPMVDGEEDGSQVKAAMFYSITNTYKGLQGIDLGNHLIKTVINEIQNEFPHSDSLVFSTLSPIPGFRPWLLNQLKSGQPDETVFTGELVSALQTAMRLDSEAAVFAKLQKVFSDKRLFGEGQIRTWERYRSLLMHLCARYLYAVKRHGFALNPVANFHLRNGSELWRLNWKADVSARGLQSSFGIMANYRYKLERLDASSSTYLDQRTIRVGPGVAELLDLDRLRAQFAEQPIETEDTAPPQPRQPLHDTVAQ